jgi:Na+-transporting NADH:ubiquinone oxidoreductase subunit A
MRMLKVKKGYGFRITGAPKADLRTLEDPPQLALLPARIPFIKPRLQVAEGDRVQIGTTLFHDKRNPAFIFRSPAGGTIARIAFGPRRVIEAIVIDRDIQSETHVAFEDYSDGRLADLARDRLIQAVLEGGMWWVFRELPFRDLPDPAAEPPMILVGLDAREPFLADPAVYLQDQQELLAIGLQVLHKLAPDRVVVYCDAGNRKLQQMLHPHLTHTVSGRYPADDPGTVLYHLKQDASQNRSWCVNGQDLLNLARFLVQGRYPVRRVVSVGGSASPEKQHVITRIGVPLKHLVPATVNGNQTRYIVGGVMRGFTSSVDGFMGLYETGLTLLPLSAREEFLALYKPGFNKPTYSRAFASAFAPRPVDYDCNLSGGERACIACMHCADVCPVDILPQLAYKAVLADEVEEYLAHGLLDCVECGLCSYVCPSKIELTHTLKMAKAAYASEQAALRG